MKTEILVVHFLDKTTPEKHPGHLQQAMRTFGPAGMLEQDDGENWAKVPVA